MLERNRDALHQRIATACTRAGRDPSGVRLVAVTKTVEPGIAARLCELGERELGENRVDELERKAAHLAGLGLAPRWHFLGHVQRNKARRVVRLADEIHSVDSERLITMLDRVAGDEKRRPGIYLELKLTSEPAKTGLLPDELEGALSRAARARNLRLLGLMAMGPLAEEPGAGETARAIFERLGAIATGLDGRPFAQRRPLLSMGMSADFELAIELGADVIRVGSAFFDGLRPEAARPGGPG